ncbi:MAG: FAD-binding protein [Alistipes sp.]|nr:FAD-binding protein [Candidatus Minthomonas equi]
MRYDIIIIGGGLAGVTAGLQLHKAGKRCLIISEGLSLHKTPKDEYIAAGGAFLPGDSVISGEWDGNALKAVRTRNLEGTRLEADHFILASGKFFSRGLVATMDAVIEPVFGCDVEFDSCRDKWYNDDFYAVQPFERFGVKPTEDGRVFIGGVPAANLWAAGEILAGETDIEQSALKIVSILVK